jgi:stage II sporulation protein AA (anti-sigma F factor antagonist)
MDDGRFPVEVAGGVPVVAVPEELDITNAPRLEPALGEAADKGHGKFVVDMSRTRFCDCAGLHVLLVAHKRARADGGGIVLAIGGRAVLRLFELTGAGSVVPCFASLEEALARASCNGSGDRRADAAAEASDGHVPQASAARGRSGSPAASSTTTHSMMPETPQVPLRY